MKTRERKRSADRKTEQVSARFLLDDLVSGVIFALLVLLYNSTFTSTNQSLDTEEVSFLNAVHFFSHGFGFLPLEYSPKPDANRLKALSPNEIENVEYGRYATASPFVPYLIAASIKIKNVFGFTRVSVYEWCRGLGWIFRCLECITFIAWLNSIVNLRSTQIIYTAILIMWRKTTLTTGHFLWPLLFWTLIPSSDGEQNYSGATQIIDNNANIIKSNNTTLISKRRKNWTKSILEGAVVGANPLGVAAVLATQILSRLLNNTKQNTITTSWPCFIFGMILYFSAEMVYFNDAIPASLRWIKFVTSDRYTNNIMAYPKKSAVTFVTEFLTREKLSFLIVMTNLIKRPKYNCYNQASAHHTTTLVMLYSTCISVLCVVWIPYKNVTALYFSELLLLSSAAMTAADLIKRHITKHYVILGVIIFSASGAYLKPVNNENEPSISKCINFLEKHTYEIHGIVVDYSFFKTTLLPSLSISNVLLAQRVERDLRVWNISETRNIDQIVDFYSGHQSVERLISSTDKINYVITSKYFAYPGWIILHKNAQCSVYKKVDYSAADGQSNAIETNLNVLQYEAAWLYALQRHPQATARLDDALTIDKNCVRCYQMMALIKPHKKLHIMQECEKRLGNSCYQKQNDIAINPFYRIRVRV